MQDALGAFDGVALANAAKMRAHALSLEKHRPCVFIDHKLPVVDQRKAGSDRARRGDRVVLVLIELPDIRQRAERDIELPFGPLAHLSRGDERLDCLGAHLNGSVAGRGVQAHDVAVLFPDAHEAVQTVELGEDSIVGAVCRVLVGHPRHQRELRPHGQTATRDDVGSLCDCRFC